MSVKPLYPPTKFARPRRRGLSLKDRRINPNHSPAVRTLTASYLELEAAGEALTDTQRHAIQHRMWNSMKEQA